MEPLRFERKIVKPTGDKATVVTIPKPVANAWIDYESLEMVYDGNSLCLRPIRKLKVWK